MSVGDASGPDASIADRLELADWRRRIAELYAEVRAMNASDPAIGLAHWRAVRERLFREHPQSPVPPERRHAFHASHFAHDPRLRFEALVEPVPDAKGPGGPDALADAAPLTLPSSGPDTLRFDRVGIVRLPFPDGEQRLTVFWMAGYTGGLFIPFRDATNGTSTYGAGRYLVDGAKSADLGAAPGDGAVILDFNFAYQPSCAFDPRWACPLAPPENRLPIEVAAGERLS